MTNEITMNFIPKTQAYLHAQRITFNYKTTNIKSKIKRAYYCQNMHLILPQYAIEESLSSNATPI